MNSFRLLKNVTLTYLLIPSILFLLSWINIVLGILCVGIIFTYWQSIVLKKTEYNVSEITKYQVLFCCVLAFILNYLLGIGEFRNQSPDFIANNFKFHDLVTHSLPLYFPQEGISVCYYFGYYLPPVLLSKLFGIEYCSLFLWIWSSIGLSLILIWLSTFINYRKYTFIIFILLFSNSWFVIWIIKQMDISDNIFKNYFIQLNHFILNQQPILSNWFWAPQHTIPACLGICYLYHYSKSDEINFKPVLLIILSSVYWSPLSAIGLLPFGVFLFFKNSNIYFKFSHCKDWIYYVMLGISFLPIIIYFISTEGVNDTNTEFIWQTDTELWWLYYFFYVGTNFGIWAIFLCFYEFQQKKFVGIAFAFVAIIALLRIGIMNDLNIRATVPSFLVIAISVGYVFVTNFHWKDIKLLLFLTFFIINSLKIVVLMTKQIPPSNPQTSIVLPDFQNSHNMIHYQKVGYGDSTAIWEYSLKKNSFFEKYILRK